MVRAYETGAAGAGPGTGDRGPGRARRRSSLELFLILLLALTYYNSSAVTNVESAVIVFESAVNAPLGGTTASF